MWLYSVLSRRSRLVTVPDNDVQEVRSWSFRIQMPYLAETVIQVHRIVENDIRTFTSIADGIADDDVHEVRSWNSLAWTSHPVALVVYIHRVADNDLQEVHSYSFRIYIPHPEFPCLDVASSRTCVGAQDHRSACSHLLPRCMGSPMTRSRRIHFRIFWAPCTLFN